MRASTFDSETAPRLEAAAPPLANGTGTFLELEVPDLAAPPAAAPRPRVTAAYLKRKLWTKLDFAHSHAVSGAAFLALGVGWLGAVARGEAAGAVEAGARIHGGPASLAILAVGVWNSVSALPMASDERVYVTRDLDRYHALAFRWGGSAQLVACAWLCWWFSGLYPDVVPGVVDGALCLAAMASIAWVIYFSEESIAVVDRKVAEGGFVHGKRAAELTAGEHAQLSALARLGSYPNLFQLPVLANVLLGGRPWLNDVLDKFPHQSALLHHYLFACAVSYAITFFATTLRDRNVIGITADLSMLATGTALPFLTMFVDVAAFPAATTLNPLDYNVGFL